MRYLKVVVQDRSENKRADTVKLHFFQRDPKLPDELVHEAIAIDVTDDAAVDYQLTGDINFDGEANLQDRQLLKAFANQGLKLSWFNQGFTAGRSMNLYVSRFDKAGQPVEVRVDFHQRDSATGRERLVHSTTAFDREAGGISDIDGVDQGVIHALSELYLSFNWH